MELRRLLLEDVINVFAKTDAQQGHSQNEDFRREVVNRFNATRVFLHDDFEVFRRDVSSVVADPSVNQTLGEAGGVLELVHQDVPFGFWMEANDRRGDTSVHTVYVLEIGTAGNDIIEQPGDFLDL